MAKISSRIARIGIVVIAALMVETVALIQYFSVRRVIEDDNFVRSRIVLGAMRDEVSHKLELVELTMQENQRNIRQALARPDSLFRAVEHLIDDNPVIVGGCLAFIPDYYPSRGRLFEPYVAKNEKGFHAEQIASPHHDYTLNPAYIQVMEGHGPVWSDPYLYGDSSPRSLTTYSFPVTDPAGKTVAVCGLDVDLSWLGDVLNARQHFRSSFALLLTEDGKLVAGPPAGRTPEREVLRVLDYLSGGRLDKRFAAVPSIRLEKAPHWQLVQVYYRNELYAPLRKMHLLHLSLILIGLLMLLLMINRYARNEQKLYEAGIEQARIGSELAVAGRIQASMLPKIFPDGVYGVLAPAREVGGDLYDCFLRDGKLFFCIGDVSGKGVPSAMIMSKVHSLFRVLSEREDSPALIAGHLNQLACRNNETNAFVTFFLGILDPQDGALVYCNAGHDRPVWLNGDTVSLLPAESNLPLGVFPDISYVEQSCLLKEGDGLFLYTDGLTEARNPEYKLFMRERMLAELSRCRELPARALVEAMLAAVGQFVAGAPQSDDLTMLYISRKSIV